MDNPATERRFDALFRQQQPSHALESGGILRGVLDVFTDGACSTKQLMPRFIEHVPEGADAARSREVPPQLPVGEDFSRAVLSAKEKLKD